MEIGLNYMQDLNMNFNLYKKLFLFFLLLNLTCCVSKKNTTLFHGYNREIYMVIDSYFKQKIKENLKNTKNKPCVYNIQKFLTKNTKWKISYIDCNKTMCMVKVEIKEPEISTWIKPLMKQALLEAIKKGGVKNVSERTCTILAQKIVSSNYKPTTFKIIRRKLYLKKARGRWYVESEEKNLN